ncbi:MAG: hypothetical protein ABFS18_14605 [Thermodesulfobacteriota bacterium]
MVNKSKLYAVLTGDIIKSSRLTLDELEMARKSLFNATEVARGWENDVIEGDLELFRGDAWQILVKKPSFALRLAIFLRATLIARENIDSRISIGLGRVENISEKISHSTGEAFILSGHALDDMTQRYSMTIHTPKVANPMSKWLPVIGHLCDTIMSHWTQRQAEIVCATLEDYNDLTHEDISKKLVPSVSKQSVTKALTGADWHVIRETILRFENTDWKTVLKNRQ